MSYLNQSIVKTLAVCAGVVLLSGCDGRDSSIQPPFEQEKAQPVVAKEAVPYSETRNVFWGDLHIHTSLSFDAFSMGTRTLPDDAYTYMKGGTIEHGLGYAIQASEPLDFGAVTDHSEYLGVARELEKETLGDNKLRDVMESENRLWMTWHFLETMLSKMAGTDLWKENFNQDGMAEVANNAWQEIIDSAERHYEPGKFTTFVGYEWTSMPGENNLHRNVIYKSNNVPSAPYSSLQSENPEDLWNALDKQREQGMENFAIPHNGNVSNGLMYDDLSYEGQPLTAEYAEQRMRNEPISEVYQIKGNSETNPELSPDDEFADFELYTTRLSRDGSKSASKGSYVRDALRLGMELNHKRQINPYRMGVIGSSDSHNSSFATEEDNYHGKLPLMDGSARIRSGKAYLLSDELTRGSLWSAMGLAAVWAEENTRESLFEAMQRKETYATSGPRIAVRFFAGWNYPDDLLDRADMLKVAYAEGVPMGGDLEKNSTSSPVFAVMAVKDPKGANLDRLQIIKGWVDDKGQSHEKVFDVAASDGRVIDSETGKLPPVGNTVDYKEATYTNTIGDPELTTLWRDPEFNAEQEAFYYARVIQIPTPHYTAFDAKAINLNEPRKRSLQERAMTSAIFYQP